MHLDDAASVAKGAVLTQAIDWALGQLAPALTNCRAAAADIFWFDAAHVFKTTAGVGKGSKSRSCWDVAIEHMRSLCMLTRRCGTVDQCHDDVK